jgi:hypothetical protein
MVRRRIRSRSVRHRDDEPIGWGGFPVAVPVAARRARTARALERLSKNWSDARPIVIEGRSISHSFWGKAWCTNLESYSDYSNGLPRVGTRGRGGNGIE